MKTYLQRIRHALQWGTFHRNRWEKELLWAQRYHDTIRDIPELRDLSLSPGGVAAGYSLLYILVRVLRHAGVHSVLEIGLGQSSLLIDRWKKSCLPQGRHVILEDDEAWIKEFQQMVSLEAEIRYFRPVSGKVSLQTLPLPSILDENEKTSYDLYLIDGPRGKKNFSRYDICLMAQQWSSDREFVVILDDYDRWGERQTGAELIRICQSKGIRVTHRVINGISDQLVVFTPKFNICRSF